MRNEYLNAIRSLIERLNRQGIAQNVIIWQVKPDEAADPTLLSQRAYGSRDYTDVVKIACGCNGIWEPLLQRKILLPKPVFVQRLRKEYGV